ncbi:MAG: hypothetical protein Hals2KO_12720 [Halioglobus sp.]
MCYAALLLTAWHTTAHSEDSGIVEDLVERLHDSDFVFPRAQSNAPMFPLASIGVTAYTDSEVKNPDGAALEYDINRTTQTAFLPIQMSRRDALIVGNYLSSSDFSVQNDNGDSFKVVSIGLPVGWFRQANEEWQVAGFVMPLAHKSSENGSDWNWQYLGGAFSRYEQNEHLWWAFGFYFDIAPGDNFYIPYVGASWTINERWTISAIMPWPSVVYSPSRDWSMRFGASPSGASWSFAPEQDEIAMNISTWDFGISLDRRVYKRLWFS